MGTLIWREVVRFYRQRSRIMSALFSPLLLWFVLGSGVGNRGASPLAPSGHGYLEYFYPGTILMVLLFTAIFSTISIIEDRREGFLQSVLIAPVSRSSIVLGRILGATLLALFQGILFLAIAPFIGLSVSVGTFLCAIVVMAFVAFGMSALGFVVAWRMNSVQGFHAIMNLALMPMWVLSGAVFPNTNASSWVSWMMTINPLTYGLSLLRRSLYLDYNFDPASLPSVCCSIWVVGLFGFLLFVLGWDLLRRRKHVIA